MTDAGEQDALVLDVGTSAVKAAVLTPDGTVRAQAAAEIATRTAEGGVMEQDASAWWEATRSAVAGLSGAADLSGVGRVALTGQMQDLTLADADGRPLRPTILYGDTRAVREAAEVNAAVGAARLRDLSGNEPDAGGLLAKLAWLRRHEPGTWANTERIFLGASDAVAFRLTGRAACDTTTASTTSLMALEARAPLPNEVFEALGMAGVPARLPRLVAGGTAVGPLTPAAADALGVPAGIAVHVGPGDAGATTVGAGSGEPGPASGYVGTSGWVAFSAAARGDPDAGVFTLAHPAPGRTIQVAPLLTAGGNLAWARAALGAGADYEALIDEALDRPPGRTLYLPYLQGERAPFRDPDARGAFIGLELGTTHLDMVRAVLEGVAFAYRHALRALRPGSDEALEGLALSGGGTRSAAWCQLFATVLGAPVRVMDEPGAVGVRGALRCAQVAAGDAPDYRVRLRVRTFEPDPAARAHYDALFEQFLQVYVGLRPTFQGLAQVPTASGGTP